jgi:hypothetical protein
MGSEDRLRVYWEADCSEAERERDCITFDRVGRVGERRNFQISDAKMKLLVPNRSGWYGNHDEVLNKRSYSPKEHETGVEGAYEVACQ